MTVRYDQLVHLCSYRGCLHVTYTGHNRVSFAHGWLTHALKVPKCGYCSKDVVGEGLKLLYIQEKVETFIFLGNQAL